MLEIQCKFGERIEVTMKRQIYLSYYKKGPVEGVFVNVWELKIIYRASFFFLTKILYSR